MKIYIYITTTVTSTITQDDEQIRNDDDNHNNVAWKQIMRMTSGSLTMVQPQSGWESLPCPRQVIPWEKLWTFQLQHVHRNLSPYHTPILHHLLYINYITHITFPMLDIIIMFVIIYIYIYVYIYILHKTSDYIPIYLPWTNHLQQPKTYK